MEEQAYIPAKGTPAPQLQIVVGIATSGRPEVLAETLADLLRQSQPPSGVVVLYGKKSDIEQLPARFPFFRFIQGAGGLCEKRNRILDEIAGGMAETDLLLFIDDDFLLDRDYLRVIAHAFAANGSMAAATGAVLADGAKGPGLTVNEGRATLGRAGFPGPHLDEPRPAFNTYGCNMAFRLETIREHGLRFDEQLPAYGWYEDIDFSRRLLAHGSVMHVPGARGVHLGTKAGRVSGRRLGYSQVANPAYLFRKGSFPLGNTLRSIGRNFASNLVRSVAPESYVDRRGRLRGNLLAFGDFLRGRMHPSRISRMN